MQTLNNDNPAKEKRNYGIDLMKIFAMLMIITLHVVGQGGIIRNTIRLSIPYNMAWFFETVSFCCVNCYALATGYLMYGKKNKYQNIINLYFEVSFYMLISTVIFGIIDPQIIDARSIIRIIFPFAYGEYWYFTAYLGMFFFIPCLNLVIDKFSKTDSQKIILAGFILFSVVPLIFDIDIFKMKNGYSMFWLSFMYLIGAYFKRYDIASAFQKRTGFLIYILNVLLAYSIRLIFLLSKSEFGEIKGLNLNGNYIVDYCSPFIVIGSIGLLIFFSQLKIKGAATKILKFLSPLTFGVYLIHVNPFIWNMLRDLFKDYVYLNPVLMFFAIILTVIVIYIICIFIDEIRFILFKVFKIKVLSEKICEAFTRQINKIYKN